MAKNSAASLGHARIQAQFRRGGMAEWSMAVVLKTSTPGSNPGGASNLFKKLPTPA
jgi:hypothetical protein